MQATSSSSNAIRPLWPASECDVVLDSAAVSRHHARVVRIDDAFLIEDMRSSNGTYLNGRRIRERQQLQTTTALQYAMW